MLFLIPVFIWSIVTDGNVVPIEHRRKNGVSVMWKPRVGGSWMFTPAVLSMIPFLSGSEQKTALMERLRSEGSFFKAAHSLSESLYVYTPSLYPCNQRFSNDSIRPSWSKKLHSVVGNVSTESK